MPGLGVQKENVALMRFKFGEFRAPLTNQSPSFPDLPDASAQHNVEKSSTTECRVDFSLAISEFN